MNRRVGGVVLPNTGGSIIGRFAPVAHKVKPPKRVLDRAAIEKDFTAKHGEKLLEQLAKTRPEATERIRAHLAARGMPDTAPPAPATEATTLVESTSKKKQK